MIFSALLALELSNALQAFNILLQVGAGTGLIFILRWFWWRINAYSEITAMIVSFLVAIVFEMVLPRIAPDLVDPSIKLPLGVLITTIAWLAVTFMTPPDDHRKLLSFYKLIKPHAGGWKPVLDKAMTDNELTMAEIAPSNLAIELGSMFSGVFLVYGSLFTMGFYLYGQYSSALVALGVAVVSGVVLIGFWKKHS